MQKTDSQQDVAGICAVIHVIETPDWEFFHIK